MKRRAVAARTKRAVKQARERVERGKGRLAD